MSVNLTSEASFTIKGITPVGGSGLVLLANPSLMATNIPDGDYFADVFTVNHLTTATALNLGDIVSADWIWVQTDHPVDITLTQNAVDNTFTVTNFMFMNTTFTAVKFANSDLVVDAHINIVVAGNRAVNPGTPGIFKNA